MCIYYISACSGFCSTRASRARGQRQKEKGSTTPAADSGPVSSESVSEAAHAGTVESSLTPTGADLLGPLMADDPEATRTPAPKRTLFRAETTRRYKICTRIFCPPFPDVCKPRMWAEKKSTVSQTDICSSYPASEFILCSIIKSVGWKKKEFPQQGTNGKTLVHQTFMTVSKSVFQIKYLYRHYQQNTEKYWVGQKVSLGCFHNILTFWPT